MRLDYLRGNLDGVGILQGINKDKTLNDYITLRILEYTSWACWNQAGAMLILPGFNHPSSALKNVGATRQLVEFLFIRSDL